MDSAFGGLFDRVFRADEWWKAGGKANLVFLCGLSRCAVTGYRRDRISGGRLKTVQYVDAVGICEYSHGNRVYALSHSFVVSAGPGCFPDGLFVGHFLCSVYGLYVVSFEVFVDLHYHSCRTEPVVWDFVTHSALSKQIALNLYDVPSKPISLKIGIYS